MTVAADLDGSPAVHVVIGVDTHQDEHVAVAIDRQGVRLGECRAPANTRGYGELKQWSQDMGEIAAFGIKGTGSYGAGVARFLTGRGYTVVEVNRPDRSARYRKGKSDPTDAEMAARAVLAGVANATPKSGDGEVEMIRMLKSAKDSAVKGSHPGRQPDEGPGCNVPGRAPRNSGWALYRCSCHTMRQIPSRSSGQPHCSGQVRSSIPRLPLSSLESGDPRLEGRVVPAHPCSFACRGRRFRHRTRHCGYPAGRCWE